MPEEEEEEEKRRRRISSSDPYSLDLVGNFTQSNK